jgi:hypothetical protein
MILKKPLIQAFYAHIYVAFKLPNNRWRQSSAQNILISVQQNVNRNARSPASAIRLKSTNFGAGGREA